MKLRKCLKKFTSCLLISSMIFSLVACGEKESKEDNKEESKKAKVEKSVDDLMKEMNDKSMSSLDIFEKAFEDENITYDEFEDALKSIPSSKAEGNFDLDFTINASEDGEKSSEDMIIDCSYVAEYDNDNMSFHMGIEMNLKGSEESDNEKIDFYLINDNGTYYAYNCSSEEEKATRREIGNIKELFPEEGISKSDLDDLFSELEVTIDYEELTDYIDSVSDSEYMKVFKEQISLSDEYVNYKGKDYYDMTMKLDMVKLVDSIKDDASIKEMLEKMELESLDELLATEVATGVTANDILSSINYSIKYYIEPTDLYVAHMESDLKDSLNNLFDYIEDMIVDSYNNVDEELGDELEEDFSADVSVDIICNTAKVSYDMDNDADVTVKFEGEFEDYVEEEVDEDFDDEFDYDYDWDDSDLTINGNSFDLYTYDDELISSIAIPKGFEIDTDLSSSNYITMYDEDYNSISVYCNPTYWVEDLMEGEEYEPNLNDYTRDEATELSSIDTNKGKVRVFVNTWSFDENPSENYNQTYVLILDKGNDLVASVEFYIDELEASGYTVEAVAKDMFK